MNLPFATRRTKKRSANRLKYEVLEQRRLLAADVAFDDVETDPRLIGMFHGPIFPGHPIPRIQGIAALADTTTDQAPSDHASIDHDHDHHDDELDNDFPQGSDNGDGDTPPVGAPPFPVDQTFKLHSRPDSNFTIFLDFDGHITTGTTWNGFYGISEIVSPNYWGGTGSDFSDSRLEQIQEIWQVVAEDFAPFDVNVTTEEPADVNDLRYNGFGDTRWGTRAVMTKDTFANCSCGGHAFVGAFDDPQDEPAFIYNGGVAYGSETATHEIGHQLGLNHDGNGSNEYYAGHGSGDTGWGPLMGAPFSKRTTQWNNGDYYNASNTTQDDLSVITGSSNFPYAPDDHSDTRSQATPLNETGTTSVDAFGIIERNDDVDWFQFTTGGGDISIDADVLGYKPNLDVWIGLFDDSGNYVADANPQDELSASLSGVTLSAGTYYVKVDGVARDNVYDVPSGTHQEPSPPPYTVASPLGYSDYGSLGQYRISGTIVDHGAATVSIQADSANVAEGGNAVLTLSTSDGGSGDITVEIRRARQSAPGVSAPDSIEPEDWVGSTQQVVSVVDGTGSLSIPIVDDGVVERTETFEVAIIAAAGYAVADRVATINIVESQTSIGIAAAGAIAPEGDTGTGATHQFTINRVGPTDVAQTVHWQRVGSGSNPADDNDFISPASGSVVLGFGESSATLEVLISGDLESEADEGYAIELSVPNGETFVIQSGASSASGVIEDDESIIALGSSSQFRVRQLSYDDGTGDNWAVDNFQISETTIDDDFDPDVDSAAWSSLGSGTASDLFPGTQGNALFFATAAGDRTATTVPVSPPVGASASFSIVFAGTSGGGLDATENGEDAVLEYSTDGVRWTEIGRYDESELTDWTGVVEPLPAEATFAPVASPEGQSDNTHSIEITRTGYLDKPITVAWTLTPVGDNPVSAEDFVGGLPSGTADFDAGQSTVQINLDVAGDTTVEPDETYVVTITSNSGGPLGHNTVLGQITNDDSAQPEINLRGEGGTPIANNDTSPSTGDGTDFGLLRVDGDAQTRVFTIENTGTETLNLFDVSIQGMGAGAYSVTSPPSSSVAGGSSTTFELTFDPDAPGIHEATVVIANDDSDEPDYQFAITGTATDLIVESFEVNGGNASRSQLASVKVTFNKLVDHQLIQQAFEVRRLNDQVQIDTLLVSPSDVGNKTEVLLTFGTPGQSAILGDGNYELRVLASAVVANEFMSYPMYEDEYFGSDGVDASPADAFFRFFGDTDGDRDVDMIDYGVFSQSFMSNGTSPNYDLYLDSDFDNDIDGLDYGIFIQRVSKSLGV